MEHLKCGSVGFENILEFSRIVFENVDDVVKGCLPRRTMERI